MQGLRFNSSLLFLHTKYSGYIDSPWQIRTRFTWYDEKFYSYPNQARENITFLNGQFRFVVHRVGFQLHHNANDDEKFQAAKRWDFSFLAQV